MRRSFGFTLIEVLLVVALMGVLAGLSLPVYQSFQNRNDVSLAADIVTQSFRRAQLLSTSNFNDSSWGVYVESGSAIVFQGSSFATRDSSYDEEFLISDSIVFSGVTEVVFSQTFGVPSSSGILTLTPVQGDVLVMTLNSKGMIDY